MMNKVFRALAVMAIACVMALGVGCSSSASSASSAPSASSASASAASSQSASASSASASEAVSASASATAQAADVQAGSYTIEVSLAGGTGKATVESPADLVVADDGTMTATIVWSSPNYDQMIVDDVQYLPVNASGNSTFEIPIAALDEDLPVQAETTAMSEPHMIDYTLHFDSSTLA